MEFCVSWKKEEAQSDKYNSGNQLIKKMLRKYIT